MDDIASTNPTPAPVRFGSLRDLQERGQLLGKLGSMPVVVFWHEDRPWAIDDRCPHMGFPLHRGTVQDGMVTCHWHHARFDLSSGCTLDLFADDARAYPVEVVGDDVFVSERTSSDVVSTLERRLREGLQDGLTLVVSKAVLGLMAAGVEPRRIARIGMEFGASYRREGWGPGLTVLQAVSNLLPHLAPSERARALIQGLAFLSRDTLGRPPFFPVEPLAGDTPDARLGSWYRRFIDTRSEEAAERALATALRADRLPDSLAEVESFMFAACTDHVFIDEGHTLDFTNKAFEAVADLGADVAPRLLPTLVAQTANAARHEERSEWRHPIDLAALAAETIDQLPELLAKGSTRSGSFDDVGPLAWDLLADDPYAVVAALTKAVGEGATHEQLGRAVAYAAALRMVRFHVQNDVGDWDTVHHSFTTANAVHQALARRPTLDLLRGVVHGALRVYQDRFLNVPAARIPPPAAQALDAIDWDSQGGVDDAGSAMYGFLRTGGDPAAAVALLGQALLREDAGFHWFQVVEAGVRQFHAWPAESEEAALVLTGVTRWLAAHTPTVRQIDQVMTIATKLRRGEPIYEEAEAGG